MTEDAEFDRLMRRASATNRRRDADERRAGFATPDEGPLDMQLRTVCLAIEAGLRTTDWDCVAEGLEMLRGIESQVRS